MIDVKLKHTDSIHLDVPDWKQQGEVKRAMPASIFADEWRECLRAHYTYVIRTDDRITERTLRGVMIHEAGFTEAELKELQVGATAHVDDAPANFVPDLDILQESAPHSVAVAMPQEVVHANVVEDALERDAQTDAAVQADTAAEAALLDGDDLTDELLLEGDDLSDELLLDEMPAMDDADLYDGAETDETPEDEPPPAPDHDTTQLSLF
jgi:hypothetical protein